MSFKPNDNNLNTISRNNYEEYFLLYIDNELSADERSSVEAFLELHPDLKEEMDVLLQTKLPLDEVFLVNKEELLAESMKLNTIDAALLLYIDNELGAKEQQDLEKKLAVDATLQKQYQLLLQTKLDPADTIVYPYKKELYKDVTRRIAPVFWMRAAAVVIVAVGIGGAFLYNIQKVGDGAVAITNPPVKKEAIHSAPNTNTGTNEEVAVQTTQPSNEKKEEPVLTDDVKAVMSDVAKNKSITKEVRKEVIKQEEEAPAPPNIIAVTNNEAPVQTNEVRNDVAIAPQQTINNPHVTSVKNDTYNEQQTAITNAVVKEFANNSSDKKSSIKGLLRKATRFIERRTNISATNENDELLIGAVAVKL